jgi:predicted enzyme related to lactoylglutathione lyase
MVGLLEYLEPEMEIRPFVKRQGHPYQVIFVFTVDDMGCVLSKAAAFGSTVIGRRRYDIPSRGRADGAMITDPNGVLIDLTQFL